MFHILPLESYIAHTVLPVGLTTILCITAACKFTSFFLLHPLSCCSAVLKENVCPICMSLYLWCNVFLVVCICRSANIGYIFLVLGSHWDDWAMLKTFIFLFFFIWPEQRLQLWDIYYFQNSPFFCIIHTVNRLHTALMRWFSVMIYELVKLKWISLFYRMFLITLLYTVFVISLGCMWNHTIHMHVRARPWVVFHTIPFWIYSSGPNFKLCMCSFFHSNLALSLF